LIFEPIVESKSQQRIDWQTEMGLRFTCAGLLVLLFGGWKKGNQFQ